MAFVRSKTPTYYAPAQINSLTDGGKLVVNKFDCKFRRCSKSELKALDERIKAWPADDIENRDFKVLLGTEGEPALMTGWRAVQDEDGKDMEMTKENVLLLEEENPGFIKACITSFYLSTQPTESAHLAAKN